MAHRSFNQRFPHFKLFLFLAVVIALPLTIFSVQKVSTSTEQHAAAILSAPKGLSSRVYCENNSKANSGARIQFSWKAVPGATLYFVSWEDSAWDVQDMPSKMHTTPLTSLIIHPTTLSYGSKVLAGTYYKWNVYASNNSHASLQSTTVNTAKIPNCPDIIPCNPKTQHCAL